MGLGFGMTGTGMGTVPLPPVPGDDSTITLAATTHPPSFDKKVPLIKLIPFYPSSKKNYHVDTVDSNNNNLIKSNMMWEKIINNP